MAMATARHAAGRGRASGAHPDDRDPQLLDATLGRLVADHGWAGAAAEAGVETLGYADCNDPALFLAEEEGKPVVTVPLDDNVRPHLYDPLSAYLRDGWSSAR